MAYLHLGRGHVVSTNDLIGIFNAPSIFEVVDNQQLFFSFCEDEEDYEQLLEAKSVLLYSDNYYEISPRNSKTLIKNRIHRKRF